MENKPQKPEFTKEDLTIVLDTAMQVAYLKDNPFVGIDINIAQVEPDGYHFCFNREIGLFMDGKGDGNEVNFHLDHLVRSDPQGVAALYGTSVDRLPDSDDKLNPFNEAYERRTKRGELPTIEVDGKKYYIALRENEIRSVYDLNDRLQVDQLEDLFDGRLIVLYDPRSRKFVQGEQDEDVLEKLDVVVFGKQINLDPVGYARLEKVNDTSYLHHCPVKYNQKAVIISFASGQAKIVDPVAERKKKKLKGKGFGR